MTGQVRRFIPALPTNLDLTLSPLSRGGWDPCIRRVGPAWFLARHTPEGPSLLRLHAEGEEIVATAWGTGASWALEQSVELVGGNDSLEGFAPTGKLAELHKRFAGMRMVRSGAVMHALLRAILEQKVSGREAVQSFNALVRAWGEPSPGPEGLLLPPTAKTLASQPYHAYHPFNVEQRRADTIRKAASRDGFLNRVLAMPPQEAFEKLQLLDGVGPWTAGEVAGTALGNADAVSVGDYNLPHAVCFAFTGEARGSDAQMLELLAPYAGHRLRVVRLIMHSGVEAPRFGHRMPVRDIRKN